MMAAHVDATEIRPLGEVELDMVSGAIPRFIDWSGDGDVFDEIALVAGGGAVIAGFAGAAPLAATLGIIAVGAAYIDSNY